MSAVRRAGHSYSWAECSLIAPSTISRVPREAQQRPCRQLFVLRVPALHWRIQAKGEKLCRAQSPGHPPKVVARIDAHSQPGILMVIACGRHIKGSGCDSGLFPLPLGGDLTTRHFYVIAISSDLDTAGQLFIMTTSDSYRNARLWMSVPGHL